MVLLAFIALNTAAGDAVASPDDIMMKKPSKPNKVSQKVEAPVDNEVKSLQAQNAQAEAEIKDLKEKLAAEKAAKEKAEKRVQYMLNPEPDERPLPKKEESSQKDTEEKADASKSKAEPMV
jgi:hypothetical protein